LQQNGFAKARDKNSATNTSEVM